MERLIAFICVEGIFFSASFCAIFWLKAMHPGKLHGLTLSNEFISRDEGMHCAFGVALYQRVVDKLTTERVHRIFDSAVRAEVEFIAAALPEPIRGMYAELMGTYVHFVADRWLIDLGYDKLYKAKNPFLWMEAISLQGKSNFFERPVSEYAKSAGFLASSICDRRGFLIVLPRQHCHKNSKNMPKNTHRYVWKRKKC